MQEYDRARAAEERQDDRDTAAGVTRPDDEELDEETDPRDAARRELDKARHALERAAKNANRGKPDPDDLCPRGD
jgi:hypothetical protein